jgi:hypothetical protein
MVTTWLGVMNTTKGVPVETMISTVKDAVMAAGVSRLSSIHDLRVVSVRLMLEVVATGSVGTGLAFRVPVIGMEIHAGVKVTKKDTHAIDITLVPPYQENNQAVRGDNVEEALVDAVATIRRAMASAATGADPWVIEEGTIDLAFVVTREGSICLGAQGELSNEVTHTLRLGLKPC